MISSHLSKTHSFPLHRQATKVGEDGVFDEVYSKPVSKAAGGGSEEGPLDSYRKGGGGIMRRLPFYPRLGMNENREKSCFFTPVLLKRSGDDFCVGMTLILFFFNNKT